jgi:hypothetical protein
MEIEPILKARPNISHIHVITDAFVPVVKFNCNGVEMDCKTSKKIRTANMFPTRHPMNSWTRGSFRLVRSVYVAVLKRFLHGSKHGTDTSGGAAGKAGHHR